MGSAVSNQHYRDFCDVVISRAVGCSRVLVGVGWTDEERIGCMEPCKGWLEMTLITVKY